MATCPPLWSSLIWPVYRSFVFIYPSAEWLSVRPTKKKKNTDSPLSFSALWRPCLSLFMERTHLRVLGTP